MTFLKQITCAGLGYLVLRELPIRNFYARSIIWGLIGFKLANNYQLDIWNGGIAAANRVLSAPDNFTNQWKIFEFANRSMEEVPG
jgi:hypothetical protein